MDTNNETNAAATAPTTWNGGPKWLKPQGVLQLAQTPVASLMFAYQNTSTTDGSLLLSSGGGAPTPLPAVANMAQPKISINNWNGNDLQVTNNSTTATIWVEAFGIGLPGQPTPQTLTSDGTTLPLTVYQCAQGTTNPTWMTLELQSNSTDFTILIIIGGPADSTNNNGYVIALNSSQDSGPASGTQASGPVDSGYYAQTTQNTYQFLFNWQSAYTIYVANMSAASASAATISLMDA